MTLIEKLNGIRAKHCYSADRKISIEIRDVNRVHVNEVFCCQCFINYICPRECESNSEVKIRKIASHLMWMKRHRLGEGRLLLVKHDLVKDIRLHKIFISGVHHLMNSLRVVILVLYFQNMCMNARVGELYKSTHMVKTQVSNVTFVRILLRI